MFKARERGQNLIAVVPYPSTKFWNFGISDPNYSYRVHNSKEKRSPTCELVGACGEEPTTETRWN
jgi:hypothetical protein